MLASTASFGVGFIENRREYPDMEWRLLRAISRLLPAGGDPKSIEVKVRDADGKVRDGWRGVQLSPER